MKKNKELKVGDLITTYSAGVHKITKIEKRLWTTLNIQWSPNNTKIGDYMLDLVYYKKVLDEYGNPQSSVEKTLELPYCRPVKEYFERKEAEFLRLKEFIKYYKP